MSTPRAIWSGTLSVGLVSVPVKLYGASSSEDMSFNQLHGTDGCLERVKQPKECPIHGKIEQAEIVKGYEHEKGKYVVLTKEDLDTIPLPAKDTITIQEFVPTKDISPLYYEKAYHLRPDKGGDKAFSLVLNALNNLESTAIATIAIRAKEQLCAVRVVDGVLLLQTMYYPNEIKVELGESLPPVDAKQLQLASELFKGMSKPFDPEKYTDGYQKALQTMVEAKLEGKEIVQPKAAAPAFDLEAALAASIAAQK
jgi:DNA end-binding protein Ku